MSLTRLEIANVRNLQSVSLNPHPHLNFITGLNGSGKTSVLEAIYLLAMGRSFRSGRARRIINDSTTSCTVFAAFEHGGSAGMQRNTAGESELRLDGRSQVTLAEVAHRLPVLLLDPDSFSLMDEGSKPRRSLLDWGVFHVEHGFFPAWQRYQRALKQRNSLLRSGNISRSEILVWDRELSESAVQLHACRSAYCARWIPEWQRISRALLPDVSLELEYQSGWESSRPLLDVLAESVFRDQERGHTQVGPHRADLRVKFGAAPADEVLSRGQMKLAICALKLSQAAVLEEMGVGTVLLVDDLPSELDAIARGRLIGYLLGRRYQQFITAIDPDTVVPDASNAAQGFKLFHVEHGAVRECEVL